MAQGHLELLAKTLDNIKHQNGVECWYARELYPLLDYARWENFETAINRAKDSCRKTGASVDLHFREVTKTIEMPKGASKEIADIKLTRYACYLVTLNGDPKKEAIAFAQAYFVTQTRTIELLQERMAELERIDAREKLKITEKEFSNMAFSRGVDGRGIGEIRAKGDEALFGGIVTSHMKRKLGIPQKRPLADFLPTITITAKNLATEITNFNVKKEDLLGEKKISKEHIKNNTDVRKLLAKSGIKPEELPSEEDIQKLQNKVKADVKRIAEDSKKK